MLPAEKKAEIEIRSEWCKGCGICYSLCPKNVLGKDQQGKAVVVNPELCSKCRICEDHCPDYAIRIGG
ncbi:MAG: 4Fe-4S binding protein [Peptococcaceae bacterium]|nr:4Fe-4S binding protein [Peptococcaceae bacterium]MDH7525941.1 4Fe-4S binding protein [Peptococcaceae bacterium]